jgi:cold shock CspA family protein
MQGQITKFDATLGYGVITAEDGAKFRFAKTDVKNLNGKLVGHEVDFLLETRAAKEIILLTGTPFTVFAGASHG